MLRNVRGVTDGEWRYIRNFYPHRHRGIKSGYPYGQEGWNSFKRELGAGRTTAAQEAFWKMPQPVEELYHTAKDPYEMENLAGNPDFAEVKKRLSTELDRWMTSQGDPGKPQDTVKAIEAARKGNHLYGVE